MAELEIARAVEDAIQQRIADINVSFPVIVDEYLGPVHKPGGGMELGVLQGRARVIPKYTKLDLMGREIPLPPILTVPVSWWLVGDVLFSFPFKKNQIAKVTVSQRALDYILRTHKPEHPQIVEFFREEDAILEPFGIRVESDPLRPNEALDSLYIAIVKNQPHDLTPIAKFMMKPTGEIKFVCPKFTVISPDIELGAYNQLEAIRINVDADDDSESNGPDVHPSGSKCTFIATHSTYREGITEEQFAKPLDFEEPPQIESREQSASRSSLGGWLENLGKGLQEGLQALGLGSIEDALKSLGLPASFDEVLNSFGIPSVNDMMHTAVGAFSQATGLPLKDIIRAVGENKSSDLLTKVGASSVSDLLQNKTVQDVLSATGVDAEGFLGRLGISPESELRRVPLGDLAKAAGKSVEQILTALTGDQ